MIDERRPGGADVRLLHGPRRAAAAAPAHAPLRCFPIAAGAPPVPSPLCPLPRPPPPTPPPPPPPRPRHPPPGGVRFRRTRGAAGRQGEAG